MYTVKPIIDSTRPLEGNLARTMYAMPPLSKSLVSSAEANKVQPGQQPTDTSETTLCDASAVAGLEARQTKLLRQLEELKNRMVVMKTVLRCPELSAPKEALQTHTEDAPAGEPYYVTQQSYRMKYGVIARPVPVTNLGDIVINANPHKYLPYSLRILKTLWQDRVHIDVQPYTHSSIAKLPPAAAELNALLAYTRPTSANVTVPVPTLNISLIWKDCEHPELLCAGAQYQPIVGEPNIVRYLYRVGPQELQLADHPLDELLRPDRALDMLHALILVAQTVEQRKPIWSALSKVLDKGPNFGGGLLCAADVVVASAVRQFGVLDRELVPQTLVEVWHTVRELTEHPPSPISSGKK